MVKHELWFLYPPIALLGGEMFNLVQKLRFIAALVQRGSLEATKAVGRLEMPGWL